ncbi:MAG: M3 family oligoendopeptidase [Candidatus Cloacimonetes bacterium]|nr:M3 family oligoendopeptidase [Candidatus Cloacimonadota bacterium]
MKYTNAVIKPLPREYFPAEFDITNWNVVKKELDKLQLEQPDSAASLIGFLEKVSEFYNILYEEMAWRYIKMTRFADNEEYEKNYNEFFAGIVSKVKPYSFQLNRKFYDSPWRRELKEEEYGLLNRIIANEIELFREENIPLQIKEREMANKYGAIFSKITINYKGEEKTLSQLAVHLQDPDRQVREEVWRLRNEAMLAKRDEFNRLFDEMKTIRCQIAANTGFANYRDYMHQAKGRFSYTPHQLLEFHRSVEQVVIPFLRELTEERRQILKLDCVRPWDTAVDLDGKILKPFQTIQEFTDKAIEILHDLDPVYGNRLEMMKNSDFLDLENRKGKAPGGYNYPLAETGAPFIFMNAVGLHRNVVTLLHESGHAMHTFATNHIKLSPYKDTPSEVAELASMAMEFLTMDHWDKYYPDEADLLKAKRDQLKSAVGFLPWAMIIDALQHWIYLNPDHSVEERETHFEELMERFATGVNWDGLEKFRKITWLYQLHVFEVPFYYIEYAISQLGALAVYRNYRKLGKEKALAAYEKFLTLGYSRPVDELYRAAGIKFDFSARYLQELVDFVRKELERYQ